MRARDFLIGISVLVVAVAIIVGLSWLGRSNNLAQNRIFAPKEEQVRRTTFEQSHAYRQGMIQELQNMQVQYIQANPDQRGGLASIALRRVGDVADPESLPSDVSAFVSCLRQARGSGDYSATCAS
jgi:hypothetical protein